MPGTGYTATKRILCISFAPRRRSGDTLPSLFLFTLATKGGKIGFGPVCALDPSVSPENPCKPFRPLYERCSLPMVLVSVGDQLRFQQSFHGSFRDTFRRIQGNVGRIRGAARASSILFSADKLGPFSYVETLVFGLLVRRFEGHPWSVKAIRSPITWTSLTTFGVKAETFR